MSLDYLLYYTKLLKPGYAVIVVGPWGVGKTFQVKELLAGQEPVFVSLFGEPTVAAVHEAVLAATVSKEKNIAKKGARILKEASQTAGKILGGPFGEVLSAAGGASTSLAMRLLRDTIDSERIVVFDDLERSTIPAKELFGLINEYVERHGCQVVVIANEEKLFDDIGPMREKLFGQILSVSPDLDRAFSAFFQADDDKEQLSASLRQIVRSVFEHSGIKSLRVARQLVHDVVRLLDALSDTQAKDSEAIEEVVGSFAAWAVEVRGRRFERYHVDRHSVTSISRQLARLERNDDDSEESDWAVLQAADHRYRPLGIALIDSPWPAALLERMLFDGDFCIKEIQHELDQTPWFVTAEALPAWRVLWWWKDFSGEELVNAAKRLEGQFRSRDTGETGTSGEILHMCSRLLHASHWEITEVDTDAAVELCKAYIDHVVSGFTQFDDDENSFGLVFCSQNSSVHPQFSCVSQHLRAKIDATYEQYLPDYARKLLTCLSTNGVNAFTTCLNQPPRSRQRKFVPFLHTLNANEFVSELLARPDREHMDVVKALAAHRSELDRTSDDAIEPDLRWIKEVAGVLEKIADRKSSVAPFRLRIFADILTTEEND